MAPERIDWNVMRRGLLSLAAAALIGGAAFGAGVYFHLSKQAAFMSQKQLRQEALARYGDTQRAVQIAAEQLPLFHALHAQGRLGPEQRLAWVDALREVSAPLRPATLQYRIEPQVSLQADYIPISGGYEVKASTMNLIVQTLHEGDVVQLLDDLAQHARGLFQITACELQRLTDKPAQEPGTPTVGARCSLRWLTVDYSMSMAGGEEGQ